MNTVHTTTQVQGFVAAVRGRLADLTEDEREELVGGLEADMSDLVAERSDQALPDPGVYAEELRLAAGFSREAPVQQRETLRGRVTTWLDQGGAAWGRWADTGDHLGVPELLTTLRPVWWVLRALCATALVTEIYGSQGIYGLTPRRMLMAAVIILLSVQLGRGACWTGYLVRRSVLLRLLLVGLNVAAAAALPMTYHRFLEAQTFYQEAFHSATYGSAQDSLLSFHGNAVRNVYPYDAQGHPLVGIQLVDQDGRRLMAQRESYDDGTGQGFLMAPWMNGRTELFSVFPLRQQPEDQVTGKPVGTPALLPPPFSSLPPVSMADTTPSTLVPPAVVDQRRAAAARKAADAAQAKERKARQSAAKNR